MSLIHIKRVNAVLTIDDSEFPKYQKEGYSKLDKEGKIIKSKDEVVSQKDYDKALDLIPKQTIKEIEEYKIQINELTKTNDELTKTNDELVKLNNELTKTK